MGMGRRGVKIGRGTCKERYMGINIQQSDSCIVWLQLYSRLAGERATDLFALVTAMFVHYGVVQSSSVLPYTPGLSDHQMPPLPC